MNKTILATCNLNQWALDFEGNLQRIRTSIEQAKAAGAKYRLGPELEIPGYGCQDSFLEGDTLRHSWEVLAEILKGDLTHGIVCDIGMPIMHKDIRFNCRVFVLDGKILLVRPKMILAMDGNYREGRWFTPWRQKRVLEALILPSLIRKITGQKTAPIGDGVLNFNDTALAAETCEELFAPDSPNIYLGLDGVEIIANGSGSHHELRKLNQRVDLIQSATTKNGGVYLYANQQGCDGDRLYYDGCAMIVANGKVLAQGSQFSLKDVETITATVDLEQVRSFRGAFISRMNQASDSAAVPRVPVDFDLIIDDPALSPSQVKGVKYHSPQEEIAYGPAAWLWDYLRRSGTNGFFLPLSGGADSSAVAAIVGSMCQMVVKEAQAGNQQIIADAARIVGNSDYEPTDARELANLIFHTCYMGTENSSKETRQRANRLADQIGAHHLSINIDKVVGSLIDLFVTVTSKRPKFKTNGGSNRENLALQNIQARSRMVIAYFLAQLLLWIRGRDGALLVLGTSNVDEALRGYMTKYDCSSADINPIGSISKVDLRLFLEWSAKNLGYSALSEVAQAQPTAELEPITSDYVQNDEADMGVSYADLSTFGRYRKVSRCGPLEMFENLIHEWDNLPPEEVARKVKHFFRYYAINRHKMTVLTPSYHAESYSPDDNRFDLRQFLYNVRWTWQFKKIDALVERLNR